MLPGMLSRGLSRQTVPAGRFGGFGGRGSTSMKTADLERQITSACSVERTRAPASVAGTGERQLSARNTSASAGLSCALAVSADAKTAAIMNSAHLLDIWL